ncbi:MAG: bifunctional precorrin-2 dehydrogenase/sirohydrochlorin ferrochelatase [Nitrospinae bacterium]|nr:bifunctional precorrin-2 dehydrogenase/sirohydrochlorin ferrochelatase [Nitrospinota bacterium]
MGYYPIFLDLQGKRCLVVGGGEVATRKVQGLLEAGAEVSVVSPALTETLSMLAEWGAIQHAARAFQPGDVDGCALVIGATDQSAVNAAVCEAARRQGIWVNIVDTPDACDFIAPAVVRRGALQIAISTGGKSPTLAKQIRIQLEQLYGPEYAELLTWLGEQRKRIRRLAVDAATRKAFHEQLVDMALRRIARLPLAQAPLSHTRDEPACTIPREPATIGA